VKLVDALVICLREWGVEQLFGVSGANIEHLHDAVSRLGEGRLQAVLTKTEVGASFMADGTARVHGGLGVCCSTSGGGMMNLAVGVAEAYAESVPVLALVGQVPSGFNGKGGFQDSSGIGRSVNAVGLWTSVSKYVGLLEQADGFWDILREALTAALSGRKGPAVLLVPRDSWELEVGDIPADFPKSLEEFVQPRASFEEIAVERLYRALRNASRPVLLLGTGVSRSERGEEVVEFAQECGIPVVTTMGNTAAFPHDDSLYLGTVGVAGHPSAHDYLNDEVDLIVAVGTGMNVLTRGPLEAALSRARVFVVNMDPGEAQRSVKVWDQIVGDAGLVFEELRHKSKRHPFYRGAPKGYELTRFVSQLAPVPGGSANEDPSTYLRQSQAIEVLNPYLPENGHLLFDAGNCAATAMHYLKIPSDCSTTIALGMGGMGYAIAASIGVALGSEESKQTMVVCGDGAFLMHGLEVHTAVEYQLPVLFVVFNNQKHGMCVTRQQIFFKERYTCTSYDDLDVAGVARGLGHKDTLWVKKATTPSEMNEALGAYFSQEKRGPGVLELVLPYEEIPPFTPFLDAGAETYVVPTPHGTRPGIRLAGGQ